MKIKLKSPRVIGGKIVKSGTVVEVPDSDGRYLIKLKVAEPVDKK